MKYLFFAIFLFISSFAIQAKNVVMCNVFKHSMSWHGHIYLRNTHKHKFKVEIIKLTQKDNWQHVTLSYILNGKHNKLTLQGDCYASIDQAPSIRLISQPAPATAVLYITYQVSNKQLHIGTGMLPLNSKSNDVHKTLGSASGKLNLIK